jgi:hypothetical protein
VGVREFELALYPARLAPLPVSLANVLEKIEKIEKLEKLAEKG